MSVPGQDERPQFFETVEEVRALAALNRVRVFAPPLPFNAVAQGGTRAPILDAPEGLAPGNRLVFFTTWAAEEKTAVSVEHRDVCRDLAWAPGAKAATTRADPATDSPEEGRAGQTGG